MVFEIGMEGKPLRKKSHLCLAGFLVRSLDHEILRRRWRSFYIGSILPDCRPAFVTVRHEFDVTFDLVEEKIRRLIETDLYRPEDCIRYMVDLGQVMHYLADYFTFPHNSHFPGNLKDHCKYENVLKHELRRYINEDQAVFHMAYPGRFLSADEILDYIRKTHEEYMEKTRSVEEDCEFITRVCSHVLSGVLCLAEEPVLVFAA